MKALISSQCKSFTSSIYRRPNPAMTTSSSALRREAGLLKYYFIPNTK